MFLLELDFMLDKSGRYVHLNPIFYLLGVRGDIAEGVIGFLKRHQDEYDEFIDLVRTGHYDHGKRNPGAPEPGSGVTMKFIADYIASIAKRVDITDEFLRGELLGIPVDDDEYQETLAVHSQAWLEDQEKEFNLLKPEIDREREKGLDFYLFYIENYIYPDYIIWHLFDDFIKTNKDNDFCLIMMPSS